MDKTIEITRYTYYRFSSRDDEDAVLFLYDENSNAVGKVVFVGEGQELPAAEQVNGRYRLYYRRSVLQEVIDLLRNEGPIFLRWKDGLNTTLSTEYEPIGEGETH